MKRTGRVCLVCTGLLCATFYNLASLRLRESDHVLSSSAVSGPCVVSIKHRGSGLPWQRLIGETRKAGFPVVLNVGASESFKEAVKRRHVNYQLPWSDTSSPSLAQSDLYFDVSTSNLSLADISVTVVHDEQARAAALANSTSSSRVVGTKRVLGDVLPKKRRGDVGGISIDAHGLEPAVFVGLRPWLRSANAPPLIRFKFDPCLMRLAGFTRKEAGAVLYILHTSGYALKDSPVNHFASKFYAYRELPVSNWVGFEAALKKPEVLQSVLKKQAEMASTRPTSCGPLVDWHCPLGRDPHEPRLQTSILATKHRPLEPRLQTSILYESFSTAVRGAAGAAFQSQK